MNNPSSQAPLIDPLSGTQQASAQPQPGAPAGSALQKWYQAVEADLNGRLYERGSQIRAILLSMICGEHFVMLGPPGVAKSLLVRGIEQRFKFRHGHFSYLMTRETTQTELFGTYDYAEFERSKRLRRCTAGKLPEASFAFLDETFKANSAILNALLRIMNEGTVDLGDGKPVPANVRTIVGASNEFPQDDSLDALFDRFLLRDMVLGIQDNATRLRFLQDCAYGISDHQRFAQGFADENRLDFEGTIDVVKAEVAQIPFSGAVVTEYDSSLDKLCAAGIALSDRRMGKACKVIRANAWLDGRAYVARKDLAVLRYIAWATPDEKSKCDATLKTLAFDPTAAAQAEYTIALGLIREIKQKLANNEGIATNEARKRLDDSIKLIDKTRTKIDASDNASVEAIDKMIASIANFRESLSAAALSAGDELTALLQD